ncbi:nucleoside triphosphate pyrophosphohydrolase [Emcibacter nanhaiensis]|uniref:Nucleoside triphosphate pyrophosphohydrolase n=1 Tax=Emcibacter nanhaiensis TaxID=1505037 RepID=A0A501PSW5_9PROT|nr:nucleoside triphosphate pyrophosphohydrolase [Emcibacter nanhaiensis]TPD63044.1 nucleoside triphosphate pyrophosphohydrolase [Emcibacter nanhaiensis]
MPSNTINDLLAIMARLRNPDQGCDWDKVQTYKTIAPYTIEEAYEVAEAIEHGDMDALKDELGDLLFQVVFHSRMAEEEGHFNFADVVEAISDKMIRRHPHVFADHKYDSVEEQGKAWEEMKAEERARKNEGKLESALDGVTWGLPALTRAVKLQKRAARVGFDWPQTAQVLDKLNEEMAELSAELVKSRETQDPELIAEEFGDMMFVYANLARHLKIDPETALRSANAKFERRFRKIEELLAAEGRKADDCDLEELDRYWDKTKALEKEKSETSGK